MQKRPKWEWADFDGERLYWAERGCLYAARAEADRLVDVRMLRDFNDMKFEPIEAPY